MVKRLRFRTSLSNATIEEENEAWNHAKEIFEAQHQHFIKLSEMGEMRFVMEEAKVFLRLIMARNDSRAMTAAGREEGGAEEG